MTAFILSQALVCLTMVTVFIRDYMGYYRSSKKELVREVIADMISVALGVFMGYHLDLKLLQNTEQAGESINAFTIYLVGFTGGILSILIISLASWGLNKLFNMISYRFKGGDKSVQTEDI